MKKRTAFHIALAVTLLLCGALYWKYQDAVHSEEIRQKNCTRDAREYFKRGILPERCVPSNKRIDIFNMFD